MLQVGACDSVVVDACQSYGSGGRSMMFTFLVTSGTLQSSQLLERLPRNTPQCSVTLESSALQPGIVYNFTVRATNFLQYSDTGQVTQRPSLAAPGRRCLRPEVASA